MENTNATTMTQLIKKYPLFLDYCKANGLSGSELARRAGYKARNPKQHADKHVVVNSLGETLLFTPKQLRGFL